MKKLSETMNKRLLLTFLTTSAAMFIAGCSNPADDVSEASVGDAQDVAAAIADATPYTMTVESQIGFTGSKITGSHDGGFNEFTGTFMILDGAVVSGSVIEIDMDSLWSDSDRLTGHLKNADFFEVETYPTSTFTIASIDEGSVEEEFSHTLTGNLEMHGVTKSIEFPTNIEITDNELKLDAEFFIMRFDWGIEYEGATNDLVSDEVVIRLNVTATPEA